MKKLLFYVLSILSLLAIILLSIFFSGYIAFALIVWVLCFGYGIHKLRNSSDDMDLKLNSNEQKIVDGALELIAKLYFSTDYEEFIKNLSSDEIRVINNWFADTKKSDSDIFQSVKIEDFEEMLYLSSGLCYDKNGNPTKEYTKAIETYNNIKTTAKNLLINITGDKDFASNCLKLLGEPCSFVSYYSLVFHNELFNDEDTVSSRDENKISPNAYWNDNTISPNDENKISPNFCGMEMALRKHWIKKCREIKENGFEIPTKSGIYGDKNNNSPVENYRYCIENKNDGNYIDNAY